MKNGGSHLFRTDHGKSTSIFRIRGAGRLKDDLIRHEAAKHREKKIDACETVERALPRPFSDEKRFPIHQGQVSWNSSIRQRTKKATASRQSPLKMSHE
jgi:hypothetical protein